MPLPIVSQADSLALAPENDVWSGPHGAPIQNGRIPVFPDSAADLQINHDFGPSLAAVFSPSGKPSNLKDWDRPLSAGDLSEFTVVNTGDQTISVERGFSVHGYMGSPYSLRVAPKSKSDISYAEASIAASTTANNVRFFLSTDSYEDFVSEDGVVFFSMGDGTNQSIELALVGNGEGKLELWLIVNGSGVYQGSGVALRRGEPVYVELYVKRTATTEVRLYIEDTATPVYTGTALTIPATSLKTNRFGTLRFVEQGDVTSGKESDAPQMDFYISGIAGSSNDETAGSQLKQYSYETPVARAEANDQTHGSPSVLDGDWLWTVIGNNATPTVPPVLEARNTRMPGHAPKRFKFKTGTTTDQVFPPVIVDDFVMWPVMMSGGTTVVSVLDKYTGAWIGDIELSMTMSSTHIPFAVDHGLLLMDNASKSHLVDPIAMSQRWEKTMATEGSIDRLHPFFMAGSDVAFVKTMFSTDVEFSFYDKEGGLLIALKGGFNDSMPHELRYYDVDGTFVFFGRTNGHNKLYVRKFKRVPEAHTNNAVIDWEVEKVFEAAAAEYPLNIETNPTNACTSARRAYAAISPTRIHFVTANPAYATNAKPQKLTLQIKTKTLGGVASVVIAENTTGNTALGCKLGGVQTDDKGNSYVTFSKPLASGADVWYLSAYSPTGASIFTNKIVGDPGPYPLPSSGVGGFMLFTQKEGTEVAAAYESYLSAENVGNAADLDWPAGVNSGERGTQPDDLIDRVPLPLAPASIQGGGTLEVLVKEGSELQRVAMASDVVSGLKLTRDLTTLSTLAFSVPWDAFAAEPAADSSATFRELQAAWEARDDPNLLRTNLLTNPTANALATTGWTSAGTSKFEAVKFDGKGGRPGPITLEDGTQITSGFRVLTTDAAGTDYAQCLFPVVAGLSYAIRGFIYPSNGKQVSMQLVNPSGSGTVVSQTSPTSKEWHELEGAGVAGEAGSGIYRMVEAEASGEVEFYFAGCLAEQALAPGEYFDGDLENAVWTGTRAASTSALYDQLGSEGSEDGPYDKMDSIKDNVYLRYTDQAERKRTFRVQTLDIDENGALEGVGVDASQELADFLTQYHAGRSQFAGLAASEIMGPVLEGKQALRIQNRRFIRDALPRMDLANEVPDMSPASDGTIVYSPAPFVTELLPIDGNSPAVFSGLPHETVPPFGTLRTPAGAGTGFQYFQFGDATPLGFIERKMFEALQSDTVIGSSLSLEGNPLVAGETKTYTSRIICAAVKAPESGVYKFTVESNPGIRVYFQGKLVVNLLRNSAVTETFYATMDSQKWYPLIIHHLNTTEVVQKIVVKWTRPNGTTAVIPQANMSPKPFDGLFTTRMVDVTGAQRFMLCHKKWDGKGLVVGFPMPYSILSLYVFYNAPTIERSYGWPQMLPPGSTIEELRFPGDPTKFPAVQVLDWGTGWTRRPGARKGKAPPQQGARFQHQARNY